MRFCSILEPKCRPKRSRNALFAGFDFAGVFLLTFEWFFVDFWMFFGSSDLENSMVFTVWIASRPICRSFAFGTRKNVKTSWKIPSQIPPNHSTSDSENELFFRCVFSRFFLDFWCILTSIWEPKRSPKRSQNALFAVFGFAGVFWLTFEWFLVDFWVFFGRSDLESSMVFTVWIASRPIFRWFAFGTRKSAQK